MTNSGGCRKLVVYPLLFVVCVVIPAFLTISAPVSRLSLKREGDSVSARTHILLFLVLPFRSQVIDPVAEIDGRRDRVVSESVTRDDRTVTRVKTYGFLLIRGADETIEIPVSPDDLEDVKRRAHDFLSDPRSTELKMTLVTDWFLTVGGALFSLATIIYIIGIVLAIGRATGLLPSARPTADPSSTTLH